MGHRQCAQDVICGLDQGVFEGVEGVGMGWGGSGTILIMSTSPAWGKPDTCPLQRMGGGYVQAAKPGQKKETR